MAKKFPIFPKNPERICWGCDKYCKEDALQCGRDWYKKGDWSNLLSEEQQIELGLKEAPKPAKPHIKLPLKNKTA